MMRQIFENYTVKKEVSMLEFGHVNFLYVYYGGWIAGVTIGIFRRRSSDFNAIRESAALIVILLFLGTIHLLELNKIINCIMLFGISVLLFGYCRNIGFAILAVGAYSNVIAAVWNGFAMPVAYETADSLNFLFFPDIEHGYLTENSSFGYLADIIFAVEIPENGNDIFALVSVGDILTWIAFPGLLAGTLLIMTIVDCGRIIKKLFNKIKEIIWLRF